MDGDPPPEVAGRASEVVDQPIVVEQLERLGLQGPVRGEHLGSVVILPPLAVLVPQPLLDGPASGLVPSTQLRVQTGEQLQNEVRRRAGWLPRLRLGCADGPHAGIAVVVDEAHVEVIDGQSVPGRGAGEALAERPRRPVLEDAGLAAPHVQRLELPEPPGRRGPLNGHRASLRAASARAAIAHPIASLASSMSSSA